MIVKVLAVAASAAALVSASPIPNGTVNSSMPPERYQGNSAAVIIYTDRAGIDSMCGVAQPGFQIIACTRKTKDGTPVTIMPNPCELGDVEYYAKIACHEAGHVQGWGANHEP